MFIHLDSERVGEIPSPCANLWVLLRLAPQTALNTVVAERLIVRCNQDPPIIEYKLMERKAARMLSLFAKQMVPQGMAFEWSALRQIVVAEVGSSNVLEKHGNLYTVNGSMPSTTAII